MLPLQQAYEVREAILEYIRATFHFKDSDVGKAFYDFIEDEHQGMFKGPYISLKTPFVKAKENDEIPLDVRPPFTPHLHQIKAFKRLTTHDGHKPQPTLLTTGTGSGKTECFMYPVLDYVWQMNRYGLQQGVKVIIMYPMNALASDQAKRIAEAIWGTEENHPLRGKITAGLFIGEGVNPKQHPTAMGPHNIIENRNTILDTVPDILLTNFKMLDYGLMRQEFMNLWKGNIDAKEPMLRFIVLDELHTYDGAQGTDVANLIRRLKLKLNIPENWLTPVGTSATLGNDKDSKQLLCDYATSVFGEQFTPDCIIDEKRIPVDEFFSEITENTIPERRELKRCTMKEANSVEAYIRTVRNVWLPDCPNDNVEIGHRLRRMQIVKDILSITDKSILSLSNLEKELGDINSEYKALSRNWPDYARIVIENILALISEAKIEGGEFPLLYLQVQLWQRELSGIQRYVQSTPEFTWRDKIEKDDRVSLPIWFCRDCGASGWLTTFKKAGSKFSSDFTQINTDFMKNDKDVRLMMTESRQHQPIDDYENGNTNNATYYIHPEDLTIGAKTDQNVLQVRVVSRTILKKDTNKLEFDKHCPLCMSDSLAIVGGRMSTLSSVGVSQIISSDFDAADPSKRKLLTFSNGVQDAAYLAGFYEVRTYRFLFRQSIQRYLKTLNKPVTLAELQDGFKKYWKSQLPGEEYYYRFLPDDQTEKIDLTKNYRNPATGELTDKFKKEFDLRVDWEICTEFGMMSTRGRTLEKMGSSATFFKYDDIRKVFLLMQPWLKDNNLGWICEHEDLFLHFVNGILHRLRQRGGIDHEYLSMYRTQRLQPYLLKWDKQLSKIHFLNRRFGNNRIPRMIGFQPVSGKDVLDVTSVRNNRHNWYYDYFIKSLLYPSREIISPNVEQINDFYEKLLNSLFDCNILDKQEAHGIANYAIRPDALYVETGVKSIKCDICASHLYVGKDDMLSEGTYCLDYKCNGGVYSEIEPIADNYYRRVYDREISPRIYAHEHTGLLDRDLREKIEKEFKDRTDADGNPLPHAYNVLSATSTLEMGINIGDLNVVANTGIPPKPSNFLQRVGRAGRKEGSALVVNYAKSGSHDLYYYADPLSMMQGEVNTPGCFLEAREILRRHFYAYCIDSWTSADPNHRIPNKIGELHLNHNTLTDENFFINQINQFIKTHQELLVERFRKQYPSKTQPILNEVFKTLGNGIFFKRIMDEFESLVMRMDQIRKDRKEISDRSKEIPKNDTERQRELIDQIISLRAQEKTTNKSMAIEFMTNAGLLPNYAFPETGIKLSATIFSHKALGDDGENTPEPKSIELIRQASQGIRELAPGNEFYIEKMELPVKGLALHDRTDSIKSMRFCSDCDAIAEEGTPEYNMYTCPKCGSESWHSNKHLYLRFTTALSSCYRDEAVIKGNKDERDKEFYHTIKHFQFNNQGAVHSYGLRKVGFGIEYCKDVNLIEANYGDRDQMADQVVVDKQRISQLGFVTCRYCGKATPVTYKVTDVKNYHFPYCNHKDVGFPADEAHKDTFEQLFLYRTMQTEAIKVLLPIQLFETEASSQLFKAGLELGLRHYYNSNPDHLRIDTYQEYNRNTQNFDNYLVIYDTIPGGTGYLSKLYDKDEFSKLLKISYDKIKGCDCKHEGKDGCYRCILNYGNQWNRQNLSRQRAEELFKSIVDQLDSWEDIDGSIGNITSSGVIEDSELELLFTKAMEKIAKQNHWTWKKDVDAIENTYIYSLFIKGEDREIKYTVIPQYRLGPNEGVAANTIPDFQFICTYAKVNGKEIDVQTIPQWSIYMDGYEYHASKENMRFYSDFERREAIRKSTGQPKMSWTLTWGDIKSYVDQTESNEDFKDDLFISSPNNVMLSEFPNSLHTIHNSVGRFIFMLNHPDINQQREEVFSYLASCWTDKNQYTSSYKDIDKAVAENARNQYADYEEAEEEAFHFFIKTHFIPRDSIISGSAWYPYDCQEDYQNSVRYDWGLKKGLREINKDDWTDFWHRYNILQFFSNNTVNKGDESSTIDLDEILEYYPGLEDIVRALVAAKIPFEEDGCPSIMENGQVVAEPAIKIKDKNIVIDDFDGRDDEKTYLESHGYKVITKQNFNINELKKLI